MAENKTFDEKEYITKMYESALESQKQGLAQDHEKNQAALDAQQKKLQQQTDENLTRTYVEAAKAQQNYNEVQNAYGLSSGAMGQARLSQDNQLQADLTALRKTQMDADAGIERERAVLAKEYEAAIRKAQAESDLAKVQALYEQAQREEDRLLKQQEAAANLMAGQGDYSRLAALYGLTPEEVAVLMGQRSGEYDVPAVLDEGTPADGGAEDKIVFDNDVNSGEIARSVLESSTHGYPHTYASIIQEYITLKKNGAPTRETDMYLRQAVAENLISQDQANELRHYQYGV